MTVSLTEIARTAMIERGLLPDFPAAVTAELNGITAPAPKDSRRDLSNLFWISIDNDDSRDLDQLTYAEEGKIYIAVADVDSLIKRRSAIDAYAAHNTTSVYTPTKVFSMLPLKLSTDLTSLNENTDRNAIVIELKVDKEGRFDLLDLYPAYVRNHAKLAYNAVASWLNGEAPFPPPPPIKQQLILQDRIASTIKEYRAKQGALHFATIELQPIIVDNLAVGLEEKVANRAHHLIENFMIAANVAATHYLMARNIPTLRRIVRTPKRWDRIIDLARDLGVQLPDEPDAKALRAFLIEQQSARPDRFADLSLAVIKLIGRGEYVVGTPNHEALGHFDLALRDYAHATAPNRRYPDLIMQRLLKGEKYDLKDLKALAEHCTLKEDDATKVERRVQKSAAAMVLQPHIGTRYKAMVTGAGESGTWVRLFTPPIEGKLIHGYDGLDVGDYVTVKLIHVDIVKGHIDFTKA